MSELNENQGESAQDVTYFKPAGIPLKSLEEVILKAEEVEALRLKDIEGLKQEEAAKKMNVSRSTFQRVLESARKKLAEAILKGKAIKIEGGSFEFAKHHLRCPRGHVWESVAAKGAPCPVCHTPSVNEIDIQPVPPG